jgi:hypothetical protein
MGCRKLKVRVDSSAVVDGVHLEKVGSAKGLSVMNKIRLERIYWKTNRCADILANLGCDPNRGFHMFHEPLQEVI